VRGNPLQLKRPVCDINLNFGGGGMAVALSKVTKVDVDCKTIDVDIKPVGGAYSSAIMNRSHKIFKMFEWKKHPLSLSINGYPRVAAVSSALHALFDVGAHEEEGNYLHIDETTEEITPVLEGLRLLQGYNMVTKCTPEGSDVSSWHLRQLADDRLSVGATLIDPQYAVRPREGLEVADMTVFELICHLRDKGWGREVWLENGYPPPFKVLRQIPKTWWIKRNTKTVSRAYLLALACPKQLMDLGNYDVEHLRPAQYYQSLLGTSKHRRTSRTALAIGADGGCDVRAIEHGVGQEDRLAQTDGQGGGRSGHGGGGGAHDRTDDRTLGSQPRRLGKAGTTHAKSHRFGASWIIFRLPNSWFTVCPRCHAHAKPGQRGTRCTRQISFRKDDPVNEELAKKQLWWWLCCMKDFPTRSAHMKALLRDVPPDGEIQRRKPQDDYETDTEAPPHVGKKRVGTGKTGRARGRGRGRGRGSITKEPAGGATGSSSGSTSSSSSSSDTDSESD
jgi:hypothetical protein